MTTNTVTPETETAAQFLLAARSSRKPGPRIPEDTRPVTVRQGWAIQRRVAALLGDTVGGWKCSMPNEAKPVLAAPLFSKLIHRDSPCPVLNDGQLQKIEPEIAFVLARDLPAKETPYTDEEIRAAILEARFVVELMGSRYEDPSAIAFPELLADNVNNQGLFIGPVVPDALNRSLESFPIELRAGGEQLLARQAKHPDVNPLRPLYWLANYLAATPDYLRKGQIVTTGSYAGVIPVPLDTPISIQYGELGTLEFSLARA